MRAAHEGDSNPSTRSPLMSRTKPHMVATAAEEAESSPLTGGRFSVRLVDGLPEPYDSHMLEMRVEHVGGAKDAPQSMGAQTDFLFFNGSETSVLEVALKHKRHTVGSFTLELWRLPLQRDIKLTVSVRLWSLLALTCVPAGTSRFA